jgi:hypothetical protein
MRTLVTCALPPLVAGRLGEPGGGVPPLAASAAGAQHEMASAIANSAPAGAMTRFLAPLIAETMQPFRSLANPQPRD